MAVGKRLVEYLARIWRGTRSSAASMAFPLSGSWLSGRRVSDPTRFAEGLALVLPGIEGRGVLNKSIAQGLEDGGFPGAVVVHDWTTGLWPLFPFHLRAQTRNRRQAAAMARLVLAYQDAYPGRPVYLVGHSGGGALAAWILEALPAGRTVTAAALLAPALSPRYGMGAALQKVTKAIWNFWSPFDVFILGAGTLLLGTVDGRHAVSAGCVGFALPLGASRAVQALYRERLRQCRYEPAKVRQFHLGGHFGCANRVFVAETVAPLLLAAEGALPAPIAA